MVSPRSSSWLGQVAEGHRVTGSDAGGTGVREPAVAAQGRLPPAPQPQCGEASGSGGICEAAACGAATQGC